jgi:hypothetical protein
VTSATLLKASLLVALLLPGSLVGLSVWAWWSRLSKPWLFIVLGLVSLYSLSAYLMLRQFGQIGISGRPTASGAEALRSLLIREAASSLILFFVVSGFILWLLRWLLSSSRA